MDGVNPEEAPRPRKRRVNRTPEKDAECIRLLERTSYTPSEIEAIMGYGKHTVAGIRQARKIVRPNRTRDISQLGVIINGEWYPNPEAGAAAIGESSASLIQALGAGAETLGFHAIAMGCPKIEAARLALRGEDAVRERERKWYA